MKCTSTLCRADGYLEAGDPCPRAAEYGSKCFLHKPQKQGAWSQAAKPREWRPGPEAVRAAVVAQAAVHGVKLR